MKAQLLPSFLLVGAVTALIAQPAFAQVIEVTAVKLNPTENGIEVILVTSAVKQLQVLPRIDSNTYIADIPNTQLRLPSGNTFRRDNPTEGITAVTVTQAANSIRVTVTGSEVVPKVELFDSDEGLIFSFTPAAPDTQAQQPPTPQTPEGVETENQTETTQPSDESAETLEQVQPGSEAQQGETSADEDEEIEIVVTGEQEGGYIAPNATTGTRTDTPLRDIPQSIQVVPQQVLEDQQAIRLNEALRNVSGVRADDSFAGTIDRINIRGFTQDVFLRDNFRQSQFSLRETANLERIEVLKGPASVLYGNLEPGGVVNLVTKKPLSEPFYSAELLVGSYGFYRPNIDLSGSLNSDKTLLYRLNAVYEGNDGFRDFDQNVERVFAAPVLTWQVGENTDLTLEFDYLNDERPFDDGLVAIGTGVADVPRDRVFQNPDAVRTVEEFGAGYQLEHRFSENWTLRNAFRFLASDSFDFRLTSWIIEDSGQLDRRWRSNDDLYESYALQTNLVGEFTTGAINHTLLFGVDLNRETRVGGQRRLPGDPSFFLNIFTQEADPISKPDLSDLTLFARNENNRVDTLGIYLQDQIAFSDNLKLLLGGRFDYLTNALSIWCQTLLLIKSVNASVLALAWSINPANRFRFMQVLVSRLTLTFFRLALMVHPWNRQLAINTKLALKVNFLMADSLQR
jgi:iron complex outermembrane receptor protein